MKRDMDLIRDLVLRIESGEHFIVFATDSELEQYNVESIGMTEVQSRILEEHLRLLSEAGIISYEKYPYACSSCRLTWPGHDFSDSIRDPEIWAKTKEGASAAGGFTFELLGDLAKGFIKTKIKQQTGIDI